VEVVVASGLMGVALMVLLSNLSTVVIGGRVAERRVVEERLARNQMEQLVLANTCPGSSSVSRTVDNIGYTILSGCTHISYINRYSVTVTDGSNAKTTLGDDRWTPTP
jgi:type II secretory pathway pseudopilin PulG